MRAWLAPATLSSPRPALSERGAAEPWRCVGPRPDGASDCIDVAPTLGKQLPKSGRVGPTVSRFVSRLADASALSALLVTSQTRGDVPLRPLFPRVEVYGPHQTAETPAHVEDRRRCDRARGDLASRVGLVRRLVRRQLLRAGIEDADRRVELLAGSGLGLLVRLS
jgi:hypothetical protein